MNLLFRTEASVAIGTGHVMRCLALAQAWQDIGGHATFAMVEATPAVEDRLRSEGFDIVRFGLKVGSLADAQETARLALERSASWVVVDGYSFSAEYQASLRADERKILFIDDNGHAGRYSADIVLNQNAHATEALYVDRGASTQLLLGPRFAMLRREFAPCREWIRNIPEIAHHVLVTMGGSDPDNITERVIEAIRAEPALTATVVVGGSNPHLSKLRAAVREAGHSIELVENAVNMPELMAKADIAVAGAGTTSWEMCFLGLPALLIVLADNQRPAAAEVSGRGAAISLGEGADITAGALTDQLRKVVSSPQLRRAMSECGRELVDGRGAERVAQALQWGRVRLRRALADDCKLLWELANDPTVRASSFSPEPIPWDRHVAWFRSKMDAGRCQIMIGEVGTTVVGQVRIDVRHDGEGEIDIIVSREFRGQGMGTRLLDVAVKERFAASTLSRVHAYILLENRASQRAFENAGFRNLGQEQVKGLSTLHYVRDRIDDVP
jgi:UDP-2,4-diacetamido-2,4,6-trideoxy-beta-L-altropyranose hydrolase